MRSTDRPAARRRSAWTRLRPTLREAGRAPLQAGRRQSGQSIVEVLVAAALMGIGIVSGLTALGAAQRIGAAAVQQAKDTCAVRAEAQALEAAPWNQDPQGYPAPGLRLDGRNAGSGDLQILTVSAGSATATIYKARVLSGAAGAPGSEPFAPWCDQIPGSGA